jgi:hydroxymethylbilane synthase
VPTLPELRIGTRGSQLALWQANTVAARLEAAGAPPCRIVTIKTSGDRLQEAPLSAVGGKRLFVKEIEDALLRGDIDLAVHSSKDMPAALPDGLSIAAVLPREDPYDAVVLPAGAALHDDGRQGAEPSRLVCDLAASLGRAPAIGTGSVRRIAQLTRIFPGARFIPIRGNLDTRLRKLDAGDHDALVLAAAGLRRLGFAARISMLLPAAACVPAPGQGIVAIETHDDRHDVTALVSQIDDPAARAALDAERALVQALGGGCQTPVGALATLASGELTLVATVVSVDGTRAVRASRTAPVASAAALGRLVGAELLADGAADILDEARRTQGAVEGIQP